MGSGQETAFAEWDDERYSTDIDRFDDQHQHLFEILNDLHVAMEEGHSEDEVGEILRELERYTEYHFGDEEEFMQDCGYSMDCSECFYDHRDKHAEFAEKVSEFRAKHEDGEYITMEVLLFVREWLDSHIAGVTQDMDYGEYYEEQVHEGYEYSPGKLNKTRDVEAAHPAELEAGTSIEDLELSLGDERREGPDLAVPTAPMAAWIDDLAAARGDATAVRAVGAAETATTVADLVERARRVAAGFLEAGLQPGDRVGIRADPRIEWSVVDLACHLAGLISVPVSNLYRDERALHILDDAGVSALVVDPPLPVSVEGAVDQVFEVSALPTAAPGTLPGTDRAPDDVATIVYKLGTDKHPRGCALTHRNLRAGIASLTHRLSVESGGTGTCFLPLAHIYQRLAVYYCWETGNAVAYMDADDFVAQLPAVEPSVLVGVPRAYERLEMAARRQIRELGAARQVLASDVAGRYGEALTTASGPSRRLSLKHALAERTALRRVRATLGIDDLTYALTATDSLDADVAAYLRGLGVPLTELYESTELTGLATLSPADDHRPNAVGAPLPGVEVALAEDGEILVAGPTVMDGYWADPEATGYAIREGWYHTGDVGEFASDGALRIQETT